MKTNRKTAILFLRDDLSDNDPKHLQAAKQRESLELYCNIKGIKIEDSYCYDGRVVSIADFGTLIKEVKEGSFRADYLLFTTWDAIAPMLDKYPKAIKIFMAQNVFLKSIQKGLRNCLP